MGSSGMLRPHPEERPQGRVLKDGGIVASWFEAREDALLTVRIDYAASGVVQAS
jgi:hypothetical protein